MNKSLRRRIEYALVCRFHWFEGGFRLNMEFIKWKLKYYWRDIRLIWSGDYDRWWKIALLPVVYPIFLVALALELCYMPFDIVKTVFVTSLFKSQEQYLYEYKRKKFDIHDMRDYDDYSIKPWFQKWKREHQANK